MAHSIFGGRGPMCMDACASAPPRNPSCSTIPRTGHGLGRESEPEPRGGRSVVMQPPTREQLHDLLELAVREHRYQDASHLLSELVSGEEPHPTELTSTHAAPAPPRH